MLPNKVSVGKYSLDALTITECYQLLDKPTEEQVQYICKTRGLPLRGMTVFEYISSVITLYVGSTLLIMNKLNHQEQMKFICEMLDAVDETYTIDDDLVLFVSKVFTGIDVVELYNQPFPSLIKLVRMAENVIGRRQVTAALKDRLVKADGERQLYGI